MDDLHPLVQAAAALPRQPVTAPDPDLVAALGELRRELDAYTQAVFLGMVTAPEGERLAALFEDTASLIRMELQTDRMRNELEP
jgi:cobyrinic acid a,c-diamide synthase